MDLNGEQEQQMLDRALEEARKTRGQGALQLGRAGDEARTAQLREAAGGNVATTTIDRTGTYGDYLKLKLKAEGQYQAAVRGQSGVSGMLRRQRAQQAGVNAAWTEQGDMQETREKRALDASAGGAAGATRMAGEEKAAKDRAEKDAKDRAAFDSANADKHFRNVYAKYLGRKGTNGTVDSVDVTEEQRLAQMLSRGVDAGQKLPGLTKEQRVGVGDVYGDRRGFGIERDAWGNGIRQKQNPSARVVKPKTLKGTEY